MATRNKALLEATMRKHKNTTRKISRMKSSHDVRISGSKFDPRKPVPNVKEMNARQLRQYSAQLDRFNDRSVGYVAGAHGRPIEIGVFKEYKKLEAKFNRTRASQVAKVADIKVGNSALTIGEEHERLVPKGQSMGGGGRSKFYPTDRSPGGMTNEKNIRKLMEQMEKELDPNYQSEQDKTIRDNFRSMLKYSGRDDLKDVLDSFTVEEFALLWDTHRSIRDLGEAYQVLKDFYESGDDVDLSAVDEAMDDIKTDMKSFQKKFRAKQAKESKTSKAKRKK